MNAPFEERCFDALAAARAKNLSGTLSKLEWLAIVRDLFEAERPKPKKATAAKVGKLATDEDFILALETNPTYEGIDIRRELGKAQAWAHVRGVGVSQKRFLNWLNKADAPIHMNGAGRSSFAPKSNAIGIPEPFGWQTWVAENSIDPANATRPWQSMEPVQQQYICEQLVKIKARMESE